MPASSEFEKTVPTLAGSNSHSVRRLFSQYSTGKWILWLVITTAIGQPLPVASSVVRRVYNLALSETDAPKHALWVDVTQTILARFKQKPLGNVVYIDKGPIYRERFHYWRYFLFNLVDGFAGDFISRIISLTPLDSRCLL